MKKILVTDLLGTLIPDNMETLNYLYGDGTQRGTYNNLKENNYGQEKNLARAFTALNVHLKDFLSTGNELNIVTSIDSHMSPNELLQIFIRTLYQNLREYQSRMQTYFQTSNPERTIAYLREYATISEHEGMITATTPDNIAMHFLATKKAVFKHISTMGSRLYAIGDTHNDLEMLTESLACGGRADFINYELYLGHDDFCDILTRTLNREDSLLVEQTALMRYPNFYELSIEARDQITAQIRNELLTNEYVYEQRIELYDQAFAGEINLNHLNSLNCVHKIITFHNMLADCHFLGKKNFVPESTCSSIGMYPTFQDYYTRVLKK